MKMILLSFILLLQSVAVAQDNFSGIWKDNENKFYSIHQLDNNIIVTQLDNQETLLSPYTQGVLFLTNTVLDLSIQGYGFFVLEREDGSHIYTRNGHFFINKDAQIVSETGEKLVTENNSSIPFTFSSEQAEFNDCSKITLVRSHLENEAKCIFKQSMYPEELQIEHTGAFSLFYPDTGNRVSFDRILIANIAPENLKPINNDNFTVRDLDAVNYSFNGELRTGLVQQGALEQRTSEYKTWQAYSGKISDNEAILNIVSSEQELLNSTVKNNNVEIKIIFDDQSSALIKTTCVYQGANPFWQLNLSREALYIGGCGYNKQLNKVY